MAQCPKCKGRKTLTRNLQMSEVNESKVGFEVDCDNCKATGEVGIASCRTCNDSKSVVQNLGTVGIEVDCPDCSDPHIVIRPD